jgi:hypothetical protein
VRHGLYRLVGWVTLMAWLVGAAVPVLAAHAVGGAECDEAPFTFHDHARFDDARPAAGAGHCTLCHFYRDLRSARTADVQIGQRVDCLILPAEPCRTSVCANERRSSSSRAPPRR